MNRASDTREQIIDRATELMTQRGFNGFSYRDISEPLGVKNAAVHYHFPSKTDLVMAVIQDHHDLLRRSTSEFMAYGGPARPQLEGLFEFTRHQCIKGRPVCIAGALAVDYDGFPEEVQRAGARFMKDTMKWLTRVLEVGREQGEFRFEGEPAQKAMTISAALQGGRQLYRLYGEQYLEQLFGQIRRELAIES